MSARDANARSTKLVSALSNVRSGSKANMSDSNADVCYRKGHSSAGALLIGAAGGDG